MDGVRCRPKSPVVVHVTVKDKSERRVNSVAFKSIAFTSFVLYCSMIKALDAWFEDGNIDIFDGSLELLN